ncbi:hypothetical protein LU196_03115 [Pantoea sp. Mb-10]|uniref:hypothetical protein n=1 Tax=unclassified Pantoea TaxID=2630326 RepID=UPI001E61DEB9|nr:MULTISPECIES: hypothetical protein [unclassified Pantoea]MCE0489049.1 hypothetical protein [Pantoea sp. Mb-10]MCE0503595.1 hypothetical protein [Pantoea sp. Pb-8]
MKVGAIDLFAADPVGWLHSSRLPAGSRALKGVQRAVLNRVLTRSLDLKPLTDALLENGQHRFICEHWFLIRTAAYYMACHRHQALLRQSVTGWEVDKGAYHFLRMFPTRSQTPLLPYRYAVNMEALARQEVCALPLDSALLSRITLMFAASATAEGTQKEADSLLFIMALKHARYYTC